MTIVPVKQSVRVLAALYYFTGIGFGLSNIAVLVYVATQGRVPIVLGVDLDGGGPFESLGYRSMAVLIGLFVIVCLLEVVAARLLSRSGNRGGVLAIALLPVGAMFWFGFALPLPWFLGFLKAIFLAASWRQVEGYRSGQRRAEDVGVGQPRQDRQRVMASWPPLAHPATVAESAAK